MTPLAAPKRPRIRPDVQITEQTFQGQRYYVLKDPVALRYFRFQREEYAIVEALDGTRDLAAIHEDISRRFPGLETELQDVLRFVNQLVQANLLVLETADRAARLFEQRRLKREAKIKGALSNILFVKIPVFDPDELFTRLHRWLRFFWTRTFFGVLCVMVVSALWLVISQWDDATQKVPEFFTLHNLPFLWFAIVVVKALHEFGHGLTCKHFGGEVHELGWLFLVFTPCFYCNVSDAWMIPHKRGKLLVTAAGVLTEIFFATIAVFVWWWTSPGALHSFAFNVAVVCSVSAVAFNANPLLRYDGYYFLMDMLELPNLRSKSSMYLKSLWNRYALGIEGSEQSVPARYPRFFVIYAVAAYFYRWVILVSIVYFVTTFLDRYGLGVISRILGGFVIVSMFVRPIWAGLSRMVKYRKELGVKKARVAAVFGGVGACLVLVGMIPVNTTVTGSAVIESHDTQYVWVRMPGTLRDVQIRAGAEVVKGQVLGRLENDRLTIEAEVKKLEAEQHRARALVLHAKADYPGRNSALIRARGAEKILATMQKDIDELTLRAPITGRVFGHDLEELEGQFLRKGSLFCRIGSDQRLEARALISEDAFGRLFDSGRNISQSVRLTFFGQPGRVYHGTVQSVSKGAVTIIPYPGLIGPFGGDVPAELSKAGAVVPLRPHYEAVISLDDVESGDVLFGMTGRASIICKRTRLYRRLYNTIADTIAPKIPHLGSRSRPATAPAQSSP